MTLKEKITEILYKESHDDSECLRIRFENIDKVIDSQEKVADKFAIAFAEWLALHCYRATDGNYWLTKNEGDIKKTPKELLEIYKQGL
jgi:hypothetical protein